MTDPLSGAGAAPRSDGEAGLTASQHALLDRWRAHLAMLGRMGPPRLEDFLDFGALSTLERLRSALAIAAPHEVGPLRLACARLREVKSKSSCVTGGERGPARELSVREDELPEAWCSELDAMRRARARLDAGRRLRGRDRPPPAAPMIGDVAYALRSLAKVCVDHDHPIELRRRTIAWWIEAAREREMRPASVGMQLRAMRSYLVWTGQRSKLAGELAALAADETRAAEKMRKRKEERLIERPATIGSVWAAAEEAAEEAEARSPGSRARVKGLLEAAALALGVVAPLRIADLHGPILGEHLTRDAEGWHLHLLTSKTEEDYDRPELWPELWPFLDAVLEADAPGGDLWMGYDARLGTPFFSLDGGRSGLSADWYSDVFEARIGHGAHIVRTLWHDHVAEHGGADEVWVALALEGQRDARTERDYRTRASRRDQRRRGQSRLRHARRASWD